MSILRQLLRQCLDEVAVGLLTDERNLAMIQDFLRGVEAHVVELAKCLLIDTELHKYRPSLVIAGLFSAAMEFKMHEMLTESTELDQVPKVAQLHTLCWVWQRIVVTLFESHSLSHVEKFGHYIVLR